MNLFAQLTKYDPFQGLAYGTVAAQKPDLSREIMDYAGSKPNFVAWSDGLSKVTDGHNFGNVRLQHDKGRPVGKLTTIPIEVSKRLPLPAGRTTSHSEFSVCPYRQIATSSAADSPTGFALWPVRAVSAIAMKLAQRLDLAWRDRGRCG